MHINNLAISSTAADRRRHDDQCVFVDKISYTSLVLGAMARMCDKIEFECEGKW